MPALRNSDGEVDCTMGAIACTGCSLGLGLSVWALVKFVEPAFDATKGINAEGAKALTALVGLAGGVELGMVGGVLAVAVVVGIGACCVGAVSCCMGSSDNANNTPSVVTTPGNNAALIAQLQADLMEAGKAGKATLNRV